MSKGKKIKLLGLAGLVAISSALFNIFSTSETQQITANAVVNKKSKKEKDTEKKFDKDDPYGNVALFEKCLNEIKFSLAFVENFFEQSYDDGMGTWTIGYGTTRKYDADGKYKGKVKKGEKITKERADFYKECYLIAEILPNIKKYIKVPVDENTLIASCVFMYCIGGDAFKKSNYLKTLNSGGSKHELSRCLTGFHKQTGVLNRCYFFAALLEDKISFGDLLNLRAEGCYNLKINEICECKKDATTDGVWIPVGDKDGFATWCFDDIDKKLEIAKEPRKVPVNVGDGKRVIVVCEYVKDVVMPYVWKNVCELAKKRQMIAFDNARKEMLRKIKNPSSRRSVSRKENRSNG